MHTVKTLPWMAVSDLDGTLLGDAAATDRFRAWWSQLRHSRRLVYASGRFYASIVASIREWDLPAPDAIIANVGTDVRLYPCGIPLIEWASRWWTQWQIEDVESLLDREMGLELQPQQCQSTFKRSYFVPNVDLEWLSNVRNRLRERHVAAELVYSSNRDLDVLPAGVNKGSAVEFLAQLWHIPRTRVLVAGDSGNDLCMFQQGFRGVVVANAQAELAEAIGPNIYHSQGEYAEGVIEGFNHWMNHQPVFLPVKT